MDFSFILETLSELAYLLIVFGVMLVYAIFKGRQAIINLIFGLYLALLIMMEFPFTEAWFGGLESTTAAAGKLVLFAAFTVLLTWLCHRVMPDEFREKKVESLGKKLILSAAAAALVMIFSFNVLPVTEFLNPGTPIQSLFASSEYFFYWLIAPLVILFFI